MTRENYDTGETIKVRPATDDKPRAHCWHKEVVDDEHSKRNEIVGEEKCGEVREGETSKASEHLQRKQSPGNIDQC